MKQPENQHTLRHEQTEGSLGAKTSPIKQCPARPLRERGVAYEGGAKER